MNPDPHHDAPSDRTLVVVPWLRTQRSSAGSLRRTAQGQLDEAAGLVEAAGLMVIEALVVPMASVRPATLIGKGWVDDLRGKVAEEAIGLVVVDAPLSPIQQRNLEREWQCKVIDRTALIIEIFGMRARTREGRLQVELASLSYQKGRLVRSWSHLERQRGGGGFTGGPGERQLELDRRIIRDRIGALKKQLEKVRHTRELHRKTRRDVPYPVVALVGYTNAGKSTLFNRLTGADVLAEDKLFATLDPTLRAISLPSSAKVMLSDTVGFVSNLPTQLVAAFRATLEEVNEADIIVHVRDISHPETEVQKQDVERVLAELLGKENERPILECWNKIDMLDDEARVRVMAEAERLEEPAIPCSAITGEGIEKLRHAVDGLLNWQMAGFCVQLPLGRSDILAWLHRHGKVVSHAYDESGISVTAFLPEDRMGMFERLFERRS